MTDSIDEERIPDSQLKALKEQLQDGVDIDDIEIEVEHEYWVDYNHSHHGIVFCWRNNLSSVLLAIEETISPTQEKTGFDIILMDSEGGYIGVLDSAEDEEEALKNVLQYQSKHPKGDFPMLEEYKNSKDDNGSPNRGWMIDDNPLYQDDAEADDTESETESQVTDRTLVSRIKNLFGV